MHWEILVSIAAIFTAIGAVLKAGFDFKAQSNSHHATMQLDDTRKIEILFEHVVKIQNELDRARAEAETKAAQLLTLKMEIAELQRENKELARQCRNLEDRLRNLIKGADQDEGDPGIAGAS